MFRDGSCEVADDGRGGRLLEDHPGPLVGVLRVDGDVRGAGQDDADEPHRGRHHGLVDGDAQHQVAHHVWIVGFGIALPVQHRAEEQEGYGNSDNHGEDEVHRGDTHQAWQLGGKVLDFRHRKEIEDECHDRDGADEVRTED